MKKKLLAGDYTNRLILRFPALSAIIIVFNIFQFIFPAPPFLFSCILWFIAAIALSVVFYGFISAYWMRFWLSMFLFFLLACLDNNILQASRKEQWVMLLLSLAGAATGLVTMLTGDKKALKEQWIVYAIGLMIGLELLAITVNCAGRYNLAKALMVSGYMNVVIAIMFLWVVRLINEGLSLAVDVYSVQDKRLFYVNFDRVGSRAPAIFYVFMIIGWLVLFGHNFYAYTLLEQPVRFFLSKERTLGNYDFTINSILLFLAIVFISVIVSKIVSYFASDKHLPTNLSGSVKEKRTGIGSWLLLVRIAIISLGLFLAFSAAGISMDKIAIILGALGVGIGFGLQTLVNNLVSGLIIAFEKPVNVGDTIEIDSHRGTVKSIGFRSSVVTTDDGADLILPNGDLLNSHLVNWTLAGGRRRMSLRIDVAYDTDLTSTTALLLDIMAADPAIAGHPTPMVIFNEFGQSSISIDVKFWVSSYHEGLKARSNLLASINESFKQHKITIPFPQTDIHLHPYKEDNNNQAS